MNRILTALVAAGLATTAMAQTPAPAPPKDPKAKQEMVKSATEATAKSKGVVSAEGSAKAAAAKDDPKALQDKTAKRKAVKSTTEASAKSKGVAAAEGSAAAAADKTPKKPRPKMSEHEKELRKAATP
jgi:hypothetical protein